MTRRPLLAGILALALAGGLSADPIPPVHDLAVIEFVDSPPTGLVVSGGLLGVPDSSGAFPTPYRRFDPATGNFADPARTTAGDALVFANLEPGRYRLALVFLTESKLATRLTGSKLASRVLPKQREKLEDQCHVYADSLDSLTFTIADGEFRYLGRIVRRSIPTLESKEQLWKTRLEWVQGDERKVVKSLAKRKDLSPWRDLIEARRVALDPGAARAR